MGLGYNQGRRAGLAAYGGLASCHFCDEAGNTAVFGEVAVPVRKGFDIELRGLAGPGEESAIWGAGVGGRFTFGTRKRAGPAVQAP